MQKAKEVRPLVEKCITIAKKAIPHERAAEEFESDADRNSEAWKTWREGEGWQKWNAAKAPAIAARRRVFSLLRDKEAVEILFDDVAERFEDRPGGYTRVMRLAKPRLGDAGTHAILELVGIHDRVSQISTKPAFVDDEDLDDSVEDEPEASSESDAAAETANESEASAETDSAGSEAESPKE